MKKIQVLLISFILLITIFTSSVIANNQETSAILSVKYDRGYRYDTKGWIYLHVEGEAYDRGFQYGYLLSDEIIDIIHRWCEWGAKKRIIKIITLGDEEKIWSIYRTKAEQLFLDKIPEEYIEEMRGIAQGINSKNNTLFNRKIQFEDILTLQLVQDIYYSCFKYSLKKYHPLRGAFNGFKTLLRKIQGKTEDEHCVAFIATGNATKNGNVIAAHSTVFSPVIAEKCNIILDIQPSQGYRFIMTTYPGAIWSCEDYYQNEEGIILTETELPQGPWKKDGIPKGVRSRNAIQYSKSIDDVINRLMEGNNGLIPNEWLIGDIKTGEIASLEQALFNTPVRRTHDGFYWSCNFPHDRDVERELYGLSAVLINVLMKITPNLPFFVKANKFNEIKQEFYGEVDVETAKKILSTYPISYGLTDGKITTSDLLRNMSLITHLGNPDESASESSQKTDTASSRRNNIHSYGWVIINPMRLLSKNPETYEIDENAPLIRDNDKNPDSNNILVYFLVLSILLLILLIILDIYKRRSKK